MANFHAFMGDRRVETQADRIALLMVHKNVNPRWYIDRYLESQESIQAPPQLILEGWLGNFFKRVGSAWNSFWKDPQHGENILNRLEDAKKALQDLIQMVKQNAGAEQNVMGTILQGLEQSLNLLSNVEPQIREMEPRIKQFKTGGGQTPLAADPMHSLPNDLETKWQQIMNARDQIIDLPDSEDKLNKLVQNDDEFVKFKNEIEDLYQNLDPNDQQKQEYKKRIENFLRRIDTSATFREIQALMNFARRRTSSGQMAGRPRGYEQVVMQYRQIAQTVSDPNQQRDQLINWYKGLNNNHPIKMFVRDELRKNPNLGQDEDAVFYGYAYTWITKFPHHLARG